MEYFIKKYRGWELTGTFNAVFQAFNQDCKRVNIGRRKEKDVDFSEI